MYEFLLDCATAPLAPHVAVERLVSEIDTNRAGPTVHVLFPGASSVTELVLITAYVRGEHVMVSFEDLLTRGCAAIELGHLAELAEAA